MILPILAALLTLQATPKDSAHVIGQMRRLDSVRVVMDSLRRWCRVASYQTPKYLRRVCPMALASPDAHARWYEDSLILKPIPPVPPDTTTPPIPPDTTTPPPLPPDTAHFSGPAELPRIWLSFPYPAPTRTVQVAAGANLQTALNGAQRGDELVLANGATWTGNFTVSSCGTGWITVRSSGVTNVTGTRARPSTSGTFAKVVTPNYDPAIKTTAAACRWRFVGFEVTVDPALTAQQYGIMLLQGSEIVLDRMYVHGQATTNTSRCVTMNGTSQQVADSWLSDCHGKDFDSQAIFGYDGAGPYRITNNYLEGAGENVMFGGATPTVAGLVPSDIEIRGNHIATPATWKGVWLKKQLLELKNAGRVLIEGNVLEGSWTDGQEGIAIGIRDDGCSGCFSRDITVRRNLIRKAGAGVIAASPVRPGVTRVMISENVIDTLNTGPYVGNGRAFAQYNPATFVTMTRNLASGGNLSAGFYAEGGVPCVAKDNVLNAGTYGMIASGFSPGVPTWSGYCGKNAASVYAAMTFVGTSGGNPYPAGTSWLTSESQAPLAAQIRAIVQQATAGVVVPP